MLPDHLFEHKPLIRRQFSWSNSHHGWALHQASGVTAKMAFIHRPLTETAEG